MTLIYKRGDLFSTPDKIIVHGCNMQYTFGSGVAKLVRDNYPEAYAEYLKQPKLRLGDISYAESKNKIIVNAVTQEFYGRDGKRYVDYDAVASCMEEVYKLSFDLGLLPVSMPKIGAGLGGGDWDVIGEIIEESSLKYVPSVTIWEI